MFAPIFEKNGDRFFFRLEDWLGEDEWEAKKIGMGGGLVEGIILGAKFTFDVVEIEEEMPHISADLGGMPVAIIAGPMFDAEDLDAFVRPEVEDDTT